MFCGKRNRRTVGDPVSGNSLLRETHSFTIATSNATSIATRNAGKAGEKFFWKKDGRRQRQDETKNRQSLRQNSEKLPKSRFSPHFFLSIVQKTKRSPRYNRWLTSEKIKNEQRDQTEDQPPKRCRILQISQFWHSSPQFHETSHQFHETSHQFHETSHQFHETSHQFHETSLQFHETSLRKSAESSFSALLYRKTLPMAPNIFHDPRIRKPRFRTYDAHFFQTKNLKFHGKRRSLMKFQANEKRSSFLRPPFSSDPFHRLSDRRSYFVYGCVQAHGIRSSYFLNFSYSDPATVMRART